MFPGRHFTPDGHLVGSIGETLAAYHYGLELLPASSKGKDAMLDGKCVEIKATQASRVAFRHEPEHALVLKLLKDGTVDEIFNGAGWRTWNEFKGKKLPDNGQYSIAISKLQQLMGNVPQSEKLIRIK